MLPILAVIVRFGPHLTIVMIFVTQNNFKNGPGISDRLLGVYLHTNLLIGHSECRFTRTDRLAVDNCGCWHQSSVRKYFKFRCQCTSTQRASWQTNYVSRSPSDASLSPSLSLCLSVSLSPSLSPPKCVMYLCACVCLCVPVGDHVCACLCECNFSGKAGGRGASILNFSRVKPQLRNEMFILKWQ